MFRPPIKIKLCTIWKCGFGYLNWDSTWSRGEFKLKSWKPIWIYKKLRWNNIFCEDWSFGRIEIETKNLQTKWQKNQIEVFLECFENPYWRSAQLTIVNVILDLKQEKCDKFYYPKIWETLTLSQITSSKYIKMI
jgi:hypothetical protein